MQTGAFLQINISVFVKKISLVELLLVLGKDVNKTGFTSS